jgi:hypothetical protein
MSCDDDKSEILGGGGGGGRGARGSWRRWSWWSWQRRICGANDPATCTYIPFMDSNSLKGKIAQVRPSHTLQHSL